LAHTEIRGRFQVELTDVIERFRVFKSKKEIQKIEGAIKIAEDSLRKWIFLTFP
jgi:Xaa-Pro aminopeptidase